MSDPVTPSSFSKNPESQFFPSMLNNAGEQGQIAGSKEPGAASTSWVIKSQYSLKDASLPQLTGKRDAELYLLAIRIYFKTK